MISILIPIFNHKVNSLVHDLNNQIEKSSEIAEIIIVDDASTVHFEENKKLASLENVVYKRLENNIGRSKVRNYLASLAKFEYLLFIDCDARIINKLFLKNYVDCIKKNNAVVCGGLTYENEKPQKHELYFRWYYGIKREYRPLDERIQNPHKSFTSFNFLIRKELFNTLRFNEFISTYGHEDTLFGIELKKKNIDINHIENPLLHDGLEETIQFINKTNQSIKNLKYIEDNFPEFVLSDYIKLIKYVKFVSKTKTSWVFKLLYIIAYKVFVINIQSRNPSLFIFDLYKICFYFSL